MPKFKAENRAQRQASLMDRAAGVKNPKGGRPVGRRNGAAALIPDAPAPKLELKKGGACPNPSCKAPYRDGQKHCAACGAQLDADLCEHCGERMEGDAKFCAGCGKPRAADAPKAEAERPSLLKLAEEPARLPVPEVNHAQAVEKPAEGAAIPNSPPPPLPPPRSFTNPTALRVLVYDWIDKKLRSTGEPGLTDEEKKMLSEDMSELINYYVAVDPKYAIAARCALSHLMCLSPKLILAVRRAQKAEAEKLKPRAGTRDSRDTKAEEPAA